MNATVGARRSLYRHGDLERLISPRSIAVVGASPSATAYGGTTLQNLSNFDGPIYPVNAKYQEIGGRACYPSVAALPETPDCVVIALNRDVVEASVLECAARGVGGGASALRVSTCAIHAPGTGGIVKTRGSGSAFSNIRTLLPLRCPKTT